MVKELKENNKRSFMCEECRFVYLDKDTAKKCEDFCSKYHSCSLEITKNAIKHY